jgi:hypothetical protein
MLIGDKEMPTKIKADPEKMTHQIRLLYELALVKNLSPVKLSPILGFSIMQIYRWLNGDVPKAGSQQLIELGIAKIRELPDHLTAGKASWGRLWIRDEDPEAKKREADEKKFQAQMDRLFAQLRLKATAEELASLFPNEDVWLNFEEVMSALKRHGIKIAKF